MTKIVANMDHASGIRYIDSVIVTQSVNSHYAELVMSCREVAPTRAVARTPAALRESTRLQFVLLSCRYTYASNTRYS